MNDRDAGRVGGDSWLTELQKPMAERRKVKTEDQVGGARWEKDAACQPF